LDTITMGTVAAFVDGDFSINGISIVGSVATVDDMLDTINDFSSSTGVKARLVANSTDDIELYAEDGRNVVVSVVAGATAAGEVFNIFDDAENIQSAGGLNVLFTAAGVASSGLTDKIYTGAIQISSAETVIIGGTNTSAAFGFAEQVIAVDSDNAIFSIDVSTQESAQDALQTVDATLSQLNGLRSGLGSVQNRLESTIRNLGISLENISAAESQIRDADIAAETAELTRAQILQQAGVAVLGQANTAAQVALSLLRF